MRMNTKEFKNALEQQKENTIFLTWSDTNDIKEFLSVAYQLNYNFVNMKNYDIEKRTEELKHDMEKDFYSFYHGNSKMVLQFFKNDITGKNDIQFTTVSVKNTYPQLKKEKVYYALT